MLHVCTFKGLQCVQLYVYIYTHTNCHLEWRVELSTRQCCYAAQQSTEIALSSFERRAPETSTMPKTATTRTDPESKLCALCLALSASVRLVDKQQQQLVFRLAPIAHRQHREQRGCVHNLGHNAQPASSHPNRGFYFYTLGRGRPYFGA